MDNVNLAVLERMPANNRWIDDCFNHFSMYFNGVIISYAVKSRYNY